MRLTIDQQLAVLGGALKKIGEKELDLRRDQLAGGTDYEFELEITAQIEGQQLEVRTDGELRVGENSRRPSASGPPTANLIAYFLGLLSARARAKVMRDLPDQCNANGGSLPAAPSDLVETAKGLLSRLRAMQPDQEVKGSVTAAYSPLERR